MCFNMYHNVKSLFNPKKKRWIVNFFVKDLVWIFHDSQKDVTMHVSLVPPLCCANKDQQ